MDGKFGFNSPAMGGHAPTRSDSSRPARTLVSKKKYTPGSRSSLARDDDDPSFNPFRPASWNPGQVISGSFGSNTYEGLGFGYKEFVFGSSESNLNTNSHGNMEGDKDKAPIHEMRRLKIGNSGIDEMLSSQIKFNGEKLSLSGSTNLQHRSISGENVAFGDVNETKFLNEIRKLSIKDSFGRSSENELKNLSIKETMNKLGDDSKKLGVSSSDRSNFVFGRCGSTKMQLDDISKSKIGRLSGRATKILPIFTKIRDRIKSDILKGNKSLNVFSGSIPSEFSFQAVRESKVSSNDTLSTSPSLDWPGKKVEFTFNGTPHSAITHRVEFRTLSLKGSLNRKPETKRDPTKDIRSKKKKGKLKKAISDPLKFGQENADSSDSYSLTDISPYQETPTKNTFDINYNSIKDHELEEVESWRSINQGSFDSADSLVTANLEDTCQTSFVFSASSSERVQPSVVTRHQKRKNQTRIGNGSSISTSSSKVSYSCTPVKSFQVCGTSSFLSPSQGKQGNIHALSSQSQGRKGPVKEKEVTSTADVNMAAQETCERWRLRGNQSYASGDFSKAEDCYTQGVNCISQTEKSKTRLRALMLCYSNRAATRMSLGKMREALEDCFNATGLDPNFHRAHVRAANCYLALGETENASKHFMKCLQKGSNACVDRKLLVEASEGLEKAQKLTNYTKQSSELLERRTTNDAECALAVLTDALMISSYSEKLLEMKADALLMLQKYEEAIQLCEQTFASAELNTSTSDSEPANFDGSNKQRSDSHRFWRCLVTVKSYFHLGKLEEADNFLKKQEKSVSLTKGGGSKTPALQSIVPLAATIHELLHLKTVGNEAFQSGKHAEAIEYYTSAISCSVESRPFTAICFCNRAATFQAIGQIVDAIADCNLSVALDGNYEKAISRRALLLEMIRDYEQAASDLRRLISLLMRQMENKINHSGPSDKMSFMNEIRQTQQKLSAIEEESRKNIPLNMYLILGVDPSSTPSEIKKAYRKAALKHHPDKAGQSLPRNEHTDDGREISEEVQRDADRLFKMIGEAYALLSDPGKRSRYDLEEETRNGQHRGNGGSTTKTHVDSQNCPFDRSGNRGQKGDVWRTYGNS